MPRASKNIDNLNKLNLRDVHNGLQQQPRGISIEKFCNDTFNIAYWALSDAFKALRSKDIKYTVKKFAQENIKDFVNYLQQKFSDNTITENITFGELRLKTLAVRGDIIDISEIVKENNNNISSDLANEVLTLVEDSVGDTNEGFDNMLLSDIHQKLLSRKSNDKLENFCSREFKLTPQELQQKLRVIGFNSARDFTKKNFEETFTLIKDNYPNLILDNPITYGLLNSLITTSLIVDISLPDNNTCIARQDPGIYDRRPRKKHKANNFVEENNSAMDAKNISEENNDDALQRLTASLNDFSEFYSNNSPALMFAPPVSPPVTDYLNEEKIENNLN